MSFAVAWCRFLHENVEINISALSFVPSVLFYALLLKKKYKSQSCSIYAQIKVESECAACIREALGRV